MSSHPHVRDDVVDDELMRAYAQGDAAAFESFYERYEQPVYRFLRRMLGLRLAGELDATFKAVWQRVVTDRSMDPPPVFGWRAHVFGLAHEVAMETIGLGQEVSFYAHDEEGDGLAAAELLSRGLLRETGASKDEEAAFWRAAGKRISNCLEELPFDARAAFLLQQGEGLPSAQVARLLAVDEEELGVVLRRTRKKLRRCMERYLSVLEGEE